MCVRCVYVSDAPRRGGDGCSRGTRCWNLNVNSGRFFTRGIRRNQCLTEVNAHTKRRDGCVFGRPATKAGRVNEFAEFEFEFVEFVEFVELVELVTITIATSQCLPSALNARRASGLIRLARSGWD